MSRKRRFLNLALLLLVPSAGLLLYRTTGWARWDESVAQRDVDLARPDALVRTESLSALPRDLLKVPLARDVLTEDLAFYYEEHPDRLGLSGAIRRIAFEHDLRFGDEVLAWALDQPAELALWHGAAGALDDWAMAMTRPELAKVVHEAAAIAFKDGHLKQAGTVTVDGEATDVYALEYGSHRTLLVAARGERVVVLSSPGLLLDAENAVVPAAGDVVGGLLSARVAPRAVWRKSLSLEDEGPRHTLAVRAHWFSFGYQRFFPALEALRFDFGDGRWEMRALLDGGAASPAAFADRQLWASLPANPALCALLPVDWTKGSGIGHEAPAPVAASVRAVSDALEGPAAACWYGEGSVQAPLFAATLKSDASPVSASLSTVFNWAVRRPADEGVVRSHLDPDGVRVWQRQLEVPFATLDGDGRPQPGTAVVTLARVGRHVYFSTDSARVTQALAAAARRYPNLGETLPESGVTLGVIEPDALAKIGRREALVMLPRPDEPVLRVAAEQKLMPRLDALSRYSAYRLALASVPTSRGWQQVAWQELAR